MNQYLMKKDIHQNNFLKTIYLMNEMCIFV